MQLSNQNHSYMFKVVRTIDCTDWMLVCKLEKSPVTAELSPILHSVCKPWVCIYRNDSLKLVGCIIRYIGSEQTGCLQDSTLQTHHTQQIPGEFNRGNFQLVWNSNTPPEHAHWNKQWTKYFVSSSFCILTLYSSLLIFLDQILFFLFQKS